MRTEEFRFRKSFFSLLKKIRADFTSNLRFFSTVIKVKIFAWGVTKRAMDVFRNIKRFIMVMDGLKRFPVRSQVEF